jgi:uncharacterized protein (TIGR03083 family)
VEPAALLQIANREARALLAAAETKWDRPVPHCPDWDAAGLVRHTGEIFLWMAAVNTARERVARRTMASGPENPDELPPWYVAALEKVVDVLGSADPDSGTWTFSSTGDQRVRWWCRRVAVEVSVHRWDVEHAARDDDDPSPHALDDDVAAAGIEEFVIEFLPALLKQEDLVGITGTLHLHAVDGPTEWFIDLDVGGTSSTEPLADHGPADTSVSGTRSDLLLWLLNRGPLQSLEVSGDRKLLERWGQIEW